MSKEEKCCSAYAEECGFCGENYVCNRPEDMTCCEARANCDIHIETKH